MVEHHPVVERLVVLTEEDTDDLTGTSVSDVVDHEIEPTQVASETNLTEFHRGVPTEHGPLMHHPGGGEVQGLNTDESDPSPIGCVQADLR